MDPLTEEVRDRLRKPFWGALAFSFVAWNWRALLYLIYPEADWKVRERLEWIHANLYGGPWWHGALYLYALPIATALFTYAGLPYIVSFLNGFRHKATVLDRNRKDRINEELNDRRLEITRVVGQLQNEKDGHARTQKALTEMTKQLQDERNRSQGFVREHMLNLRLFIRNESRLYQSLVRAGNGQPLTGADERAAALLKDAGLLDTENRITVAGRAVLGKG